MDKKIDILEEQSNEILEKINYIYTILKLLNKIFENNYAEIQPLLELITKEVQTIAELSDIHNMELMKIKYKL